MVEAVTLPADLSCAAQFDVSGLRWFLQIEGGRVAGWDLGSLEVPDVEVRWEAGDARRILGREVRGTDALRVTTVLAPSKDGPYVGPPAPVNLACRPELASLPFVPGATLNLQFCYRRGPFGDVDHVQRFEDGQFAEDCLGTDVQADVIVDITYRAMARVRAGEISIIEALEGGAITGAVGPLATLAGIMESPAWHAAELASGRHALALAVLGEFDANPTFASAMKELAVSAPWE
jgi:hypothetical protein